MNTSRIHPRSRGFTLIELLVVISIIAIIAGFAFPAFAAFLKKGRMADQLNNGRQIMFAVKSYASETSHGGQYPAYKDPDDANTLLQSTNDLGEVLMPRYLGEKKVFINKNSAWSKRPIPQSEANRYDLQSGESDWVYVRGLSDTSPSNWPILANAFAPGQTTYVADPNQKGGVWGGVSAVVLYSGGSAEVVETKESGGGFMVKRPDQATSNAFEKEGEWLSGDDVEVLHPM